MLKTTTYMFLIKQNFASTNECSEIRSFICNRKIVKGVPVPWSPVVPVLSRAAGRSREGESGLVSTRMALPVCLLMSFFCREPPFFWSLLLHFMSLCTCFPWCFWVGSPHSEFYHVSALDGGQACGE